MMPEKLKQECIALAPTVQLGNLLDFAYACGKWDAMQESLESITRVTDKAVERVLHES